MCIINKPQNEIHFRLTTTLTPEQFVAGLTDFGTGRSKLFSNSANEYLQVHQRGQRSSASGVTKPTDVRQAVDVAADVEDDRMTKRRSGTSHLNLILFLTLGVLLFAGGVQAQNLGLEGETGVFITPVANTAPSEANGLGKPVVSYHFLNTGDVVGPFSWISVTEGAFGRVEFGYTRNLHSAGDNQQLSPLWHNGFDIVHGKVNLVPENLGGKHNWVPGVGTGFILRTQVHNIGGAISNKDTHNGDVYLVATKTITQFKLPIILNGGVRGTNAVLWGIGGNSPNFEARGFGAAGFMLPGPKKSVVLFAAEVAQQPRHPEGLPAAIIPTTLTYDVRVIPRREGRLNLDFGVAQLANHIMPGADLKARHQFGMAISYAF